MPKMRSTDQRRRLAAFGLSAAVFASLTVGAAASAGATPTTAPNHHGCAAVDPRLAKPGPGSADVIVVGRASAARQVRTAVVRAGGRITAAEPIVSGYRATIPRRNLRAVACSAGVQGLSPNSVVHFAGLSGGQASSGPGSQFLRATQALQLGKRGLNGNGVGVAVIDTGISPMSDVAGRVVYGPDLSGEGTYIDTYGHGTVMGALIGGDGSDSAAATGKTYTGVAPGATLISVKVAGRNGATDVSTVLQAMHWVSAYKDEFNIRVLNLSWGTPSTQSPTVDPLDYAVERLWRQGIVVVVAAGNAGPNPRTILKPGDDPLVLTVGAYADAGTNGVADDYVPAWSSVGPTADGTAKPDLVAPGRTLIAQRSFGSAVEQGNPQALISPSYIKASGTSEATAVTSGAVALMLQARPDLTPDQVKSILVRTARPIAGTPAAAQGAGRLSLAAAPSAPAGAAVQQVGAATGLGSLEASRGGVHVAVDCDGDGTPEPLVGEITARCEPWTGAAWTGAAWTGAAWTGAAWTGAAWTGAAWTGAAWTGAAWTGAAWTGAAWTGAAWTGAAWTGAAWTGAAWTGAAWTGAAWTGAAWTGAAWTGAAWTGAAWTGAAWTGGAWTNDEWSSDSSSPTEFLTAWWGDEPQPGQQVSGEHSG